MNPSTNSIAQLWLVVLIVPLVRCEDWSTNDAWKYGFGASFLVSSIGFMMSAFVVLMLKFNVKQSKIMVGMFISFAVGALLGDVLFHILPEMYGAHGHEEEHSDSVDEWKDGEESPAEVKPLNPNILSLMVLMGILAFSILEITMTSLGVKHSHGADNQSEQENEEENSHDHKKIPNDPKVEVKVVTAAIEDIQMDNLSPKDDPQTPETPKGWIESWRNKRTEGWLNLISDFIHNILDGIAIGVAFMSKNKNVAITTWVAIIAHEIPGELGDMGILIHSKFSNKQALFCNGMVNFSALLGSFIGLGIGSIDENSEKLVLSFVAGNFIYISCVDMIPQLLKDKSVYRKMAFVLTAVVAGLIMWSVTFAESG